MILGVFHVLKFHLNIHTNISNWHIPGITLADTKLTIPPSTL